jgi:hypothetical protein
MAASSGGGTPANKAIAAGDALASFGPGQNVTLLTATLRTSKPTDLMLQTTLECSILTKLTTGGANSAANSTSSADTTASIRGWIEVDDDPLAIGTTPGTTETAESGAPARIVPVQSTSQPPQDGSDPNSGDKVIDAATFCNRTYARSVTDTENDDDGIDQQSDYIDTKSANAFNWVLLNAGSGIHYVRLMADLSASNAQGTCDRATDPVTPETCSEAYVGNRTLIIEPTKMANDAVINNPATS